MTCPSCDDLVRCDCQDELRPCPFCGGKVDAVTGMTPSGEIYPATTCGCIGFKRVSIKVWNNAWCWKKELTNGK